MAAKAAIIKDEIGIALDADRDFRSDLGGQFKSFQKNLLPALTPDEFADIYAETITYGMFAARFHDKELDTFSRQEALEDLPASNPFLKGLFGYIAGVNLPDRLKYIVDDLVALMRASDPHSLFKDYGKWDARNDPFVHFYEDFLAAYNPKKRKSRGVWYTPEPVVDFIVRAVDDVLKTEFGLADGLADTSKVTIDWDTGLNHPKTGKALTEKREVHKVQILDPATGTGTILAKTVQLIADRVKAKAPGKWSGYVEQDLLPRLHGFELLMASYAMCHMKLDMMLDQTGYKPSARPPRLSVWLTNALEPADRHVADMFFQPLAEEARGASEVKRQTPIMCVIGNPPYSGESANKGDHIMALMEAYKKEPGGKERLKERNPKWINDDYVKFIRMAEDLIAKNPSGGVLGFITNYGYLDNPTFRGMRWHLLKTFDKIWVVDLHGNAKKKEVSPDGSNDVNVFDIMQGVALVIAVRKKDRTVDLAEVWHGDLWGGRAVKNEALWAGTPATLSRVSLSQSAPQYPFVARDYDLEHSYRQGLSVADLMPVNGVGMVTARDGFVIGDRQALADRFSAFQTCRRDEDLLHSEFSVPRKMGWSILDAHDALQGKVDLTQFICPITYRPFDRRHIFYEDNAVWRTVRKVMDHARVPQNFSLVFNRTVEEKREYTDIFTFAGMIQHHSLSLKEVNYIAPLYLYPDHQAKQGDVFAPKSRTPNLDSKLYAALCKAAGIEPADTAGVDDDFHAASGDARPSEVKVFDYVYGVLHSPAYRKTYAEFLKIDFPRVPYPPSPEVFRHVSEKGEQLRRLHLMEPAAIGETPYVFEGEGDDVVAAGYPKLENGKVQINKHQHFAGVPKLAWEFHIGGYQPAQKWLKDRRGRTLSYEDIGHYQKIIKILVETDRIMKEIELPLGP